MELKMFGYKPIAIPCDLSEYMFEENYTTITQYTEFKKVYLAVARNIVPEARLIYSKHRDKIYLLEVMLDFKDDAWAMRGQYNGIYSEGA